MLKCVQTFDNKILSWFFIKWDLQNNSGLQEFFSSVVLLL
jgi:hypothetical protein